MSTKPSSSRVRPLRTLRDLALDTPRFNRGTPRGQQQLAHSLRDLGAGRSIVTDRHGRIIAGNHTVEQARSLDLPIAVVRTTGDRLVVVQRTDLDLTADPQARRLAVADNRTGELNLIWDVEALQAALEDGLDLTEFWTESELERLLGDASGSGDDDATVTPRETTIQRGDLFALGPHRVLCGDATDPGTVARVLDGAQPPLMTTDPPYGVDYDPSWRASLPRNRRTAIGAVANDDQADWQPAYALFPGDVAYVWHAGLHAACVARGLEAAGFALRSQIIWAKQHFALSRGDYHWQHEPCWYAVRRGASAHWRGGRTQSTLWEVPNLSPLGGQRDGENAPTGHGTQKPVRVFEMPMRHHTATGDAVYDPFVGSGTAVIAAEKTGRRCVALEIDPRYVQATVDRWEAYTGHRARQLEGSR